MNIWMVMAKIEDIQARSIDRAFDSKEKLGNIRGIDSDIEEWDVE